MSTHLVLTVIAADRPGLVSQLSDTITAGGDKDVITAGDGVNIISIGDGDNTVTAGTGATVGYARDVFGNRVGRTELDAGGQVVAEGTPEQVAKVAGSFTGEFLRSALAGVVG